MERGTCVGATAGAGMEGSSNRLTPQPEPALSDDSRLPPDPAPPDRTGPIRRAYTPITGRGRDVDSFGRAMGARAVLWSLVGGFLGFLLGIFLRVSGHGPWVIPVTTLVGWTASYVCIVGILGAAGRAGSALYAPSGRTTPRKREYSLAESYVARGEYERAVDAFEEAILEDPTDPQPYLRVARLQRDRLGAPEAAARWFKRALAESEAGPGATLLARKELVELYRGPLRTPRKAAPLLARIAEDSAGTPEAEWAARELADIKAAMSDGPDGP